MIKWIPNGILRMGYPRKRLYYTTPSVLPTGGLRNRETFMCGKNISNVCGRQWCEWGTYVRTFICLHIKGAEKNSWLWFLNHFLPLDFWHLQLGLHYLSHGSLLRATLVQKITNFITDRLSVRSEVFIFFFTPFLQCNDWLGSCGGYTLSQKSLSIIIILFVLLHVRRVVDKLPLNNYGL
jgi:hypothetical protein